MEVNSWFKGDFPEVSGKGENPGRGYHGGVHSELELSDDVTGGVSNTQRRGGGTGRGIRFSVVKTLHV